MKKFEKATPAFLVICEWVGISLVAVARWSEFHSVSDTLAIIGGVFLFQLLGLTIILLSRRFRRVS
jgi:hypothetical protein